MKAKIDQGLLLAVLFLMGLGLVQVYSSSFIFAIESYDDGLFFVKKQLLYLFVGLAGLLFGFLVPWSTMKKWGWVFWVIAVVGVALTLVPSLTIKAGGAGRWLRLPLGQRFEPGELLKISFPIFTAYFVSLQSSRLGAFKNWIWGVLTILPLTILLKQPDFGSLVICGAVLGGTLFAYGLRWRYLVGVALAAVPAFYFLVWNVGYRRARIQGFLDPWSDPGEKGFQIIQSMLSFHSGGIWGAGLGQGQGKLFFLPEAHTDFTLAVLGEEMGFLGIIFVILLYGFVIFKGFQITVRTRDHFSHAVALGITMTFCLSVFINMGMAMGLLPTKGLALPFMSYGGSSLLCTCFACGILLNIGRDGLRPKKRKAFHGYRI